MPTTTQSIARLKGQRPIVAVTAYDAIMAAQADAAGVDLILVGDSVGTTVLGFDTTIPVTLDMMVHHSAAVARARPNALVVADVPFTLAHESFDAVLRACRRLMQEGGAEAVKLEGAASGAETAARLTRAGVPVLGHIGLLPQQYHQLGGYRKFGRDETEKAALVRDALALQRAECFAVVAEMVEGTVAGTIAAELAIPLIGIGCGPHCDGQILVSHDLLGLTPGNVPSFAKAFGTLGGAAKEAFQAYAEAVRSGTFPS